MNRLYIHCFSLYPGPVFFCSGTATGSVCFLEEHEEDTEADDDGNDETAPTEVCNLEVYFDAVFLDHYLALEGKIESVDLSTLHKC